MRTFARIVLVGGFFGGLLWAALGDLSMTEIFKIAEQMVLGILVVMVFGWLVLTAIWPD